MDRLTIQKRSWNMSRIKSRNTNPEIKLRKFLHKSGFRYRIHFPIAGKPDIAFPSRKVAIFIHGCFWHLHGCKNSVIPKTNTEFWQAKLQSNVDRYSKVKKILKKNGWTLYTLWECQLEKQFEHVTSKLVNKLNFH